MSKEYLRQAALLGAFIDAAHQQTRSCGETLVQKATYVMKTLFDAPFSDDFRIHYYGPFSFGLRDRLSSMEADEILRVSPRDMGVSYELGPRFEQLKSRFPKTLETYFPAIDFAAKNLAPLGVKQLEPLATALFVTKTHEGSSIGTRAVELRKIKPYLTVETAETALKTVDDWIGQTKM